MLAYGAGWRPVLEGISRIRRYLHWDVWPSDILPLLLPALLYTFYKYMHSFIRNLDEETRADIGL